ncbi:MAG: sugar ABC transporter permease [Actinomycetia bacterium]|nr:sugar ABC transporter permease [Actinomycetes bacterium]MCP4960103.1 sugar ABC transporter permease [Actinomycetes bacterium]
MPSVLVILGWALLLGTVGIWIVLWALNSLVDLVPSRWRESVRPYVYLAPAYLLLTLFLLYPLVATIYYSVTEDQGLSNFPDILGDDDVQRALINNLIWLVVATGGSVLLGLVIAQLFDRVKREALAKTFVFLPLALSMVGASVIFRFMYLWRPEGQPQIGVVNALVTGVGKEPIPILQDVPINTFALIAIMVWLQTGFAMVVLSAAIKGVPDELLEAARIDGASELQVFTRIIVPSIRPSIITVSTTIAVAVLKVFDIVFVTTGGKFDTEVIANRMFAEMFKFRNFGRASSIAVLLFLMVLPVMWMNLRNFRRQEAMQ